MFKFINELPQRANFFLSNEGMRNSGEANTRSKLQSAKLSGDRRQILKNLKEDIKLFIVVFIVVSL